MGPAWHPVNPREQDCSRPRAQQWSCAHEGGKCWHFPQMVKNLPAMQESWVQSLGQEDFLEKEMATHSSMLAWEIPWTEEPDGL